MRYLAWLHGANPDARPFATLGLLVVYATQPAADPDVTAGLARLLAAEAEPAALEAVAVADGRRVRRTCNALVAHTGKAWPEVSSLR